MPESIVKSLTGGNQASAARHAASAQVAGADNAIGTYNNNLTNSTSSYNNLISNNNNTFNPYINSGKTANGELGYLLGTSSTGDSAGGTLGGQGSLAQPFSQAAFQEDPGYQFRMDQGQQALSRSAAASGGVLSGAALKAATNYGQQSASSEYQNAYDRYNQNQNNLYSKLSGQQGVGLTAGNALANTNLGATNSLNSIGLNTAKGISDLQTGIGTAQGAGITGAANAYQQGFNNLAGGFGSFATPGGIGSSAAGAQTIYNGFGPDASSYQQPTSGQSGLGNLTSLIAKYGPMIAAAG